MNISKTFSQATALILANLEFEELPICREVCKEFCQVADKALWKLIFPKEVPPSAPNKVINVKDFSLLIDSEDELIRTIGVLVDNLEFNRNSIFRFSFIQPNAQPTIELKVNYNPADLNFKIYNYLITNRVIPSAVCLKTSAMCSSAQFELTYFNTKHFPKYQKQVNALRLQYLAGVADIDMTGKEVKEVLEVKFRKPSPDSSIHKFLERYDSYESFTKQMFEYVSQKLSAEYTSFPIHEVRLETSEKFLRLIDYLSDKLAEAVITNENLMPGTPLGLERQINLFKNLAERWDGSYRPTANITSIKQTYSVETNRLKEYKLMLLDV